MDLLSSLGHAGVCADIVTPAASGDSSNVVRSGQRWEQSRIVRFTALQVRQQVFRTELSLDAFGVVSCRHQPRNQLRVAGGIPVPDAAAAIVAAQRSRHCPARSP